MSTDRLRCRKCDHVISPCAIRACPHPAVKAKYGDNVQICAFCCRKCTFAVKSPLCGAVKCGYEKEKKS